jgi:hypothetical protein
MSGTMRRYASLDDAWKHPRLMVGDPETFKVTMPYGDWVNYVASGDNTLLGGAVIPSGTDQLPGGVGGGAVYAGQVGRNIWYG